jgi:copper chaperone NosL
VTKLSRLMVAIAALLLIGMYFFPLWRIDLGAPQYPEGLGMHVWVNNVSGIKPHDLDNINMLNHYIGMPPIEADAIPELRFFPWILAGLIGFGLVAAITGRRRVVMAWLGTLVAVGVAGLADFWRWGYQFGHNLDLENAIIKVPGMAYQPPLFGTKQLLNFTATSWPDVGTAAAGLAFLVGAAALYMTRPRRETLARGLAAVALVGFTACASGPQPIRYGEENCAQCRMTISDPRFGATVVTATGKSLSFDSVECLASYAAAAEPEAVRELWVSDFMNAGALLPAADALYLHGGALSSPMGRAIAAFAPGIDQAAVRAEFGGEFVEWARVVSLSGDAHQHPLTDSADATHSH